MRWCTRFALVAAVACATTQEPEPREAPVIGTAEEPPPPPASGEAEALPASLDRYFPPAAQGPAYLIEMFSLEQPFTAIGIDLEQGDAEGANASYSAFKAQYVRLSTMVPEWSDRFPMEPVEALGTALQSRDPAAVGAAMGRVGQVCGACHDRALILSHQRYHWRRFDGIELADPVANGERVTYFEYMVRLARSFTGISTDLRQGQVDHAREHYRAFKSRFERMAQTACNACHDLPRAYFADREMIGTVAALGEALQATPPDGQRIGELSGRIGTESCMKCHLVHLPAAVAQRRTAPPAPPAP